MLTVSYVWYIPYSCSVRSSELFTEIPVVLSTKWIFWRNITKIWLLRVRNIAYCAELYSLFKTLLRIIGHIVGCKLIKLLHDVELLADFRPTVE